MKKKFDLEQYSSKKNKYVMHCRTKEESEDFCNYLDSVGRKWNNNKRYTECDVWNIYEEETCYNFNTGEYCFLDYYNEEDYIILEWSNFGGGIFTKTNLKNGDVVKFRSGLTGIYIQDLNSFITKNNYIDVDCYEFNLKNKQDKYLDIIVVNRPKEKKDCCFEAIDKDYGEQVYFRAIEPSPCLFLNEDGLAVSIKNSYSSTLEANYETI